jgi:hypothetical protein
VTPEQERELFRRISRISRRVDFIFSSLIILFVFAMYGAIMKWFDDYIKIPGILGSVVAFIVFVLLMWIGRRAIDEDN